MKSKRKIVKSLVFVGLVLVFALSLVSQSEAQHRRLRGEYAVVGEMACVAHWLINPNNPNDPTATPYWTTTSSVQGTLIFNGNGTGSGEVSQVEVVHPIYTPIPLGAYWGFPLPTTILGHTNTYDLSFHFTYSVLPNGSITRTVTPEGFIGTVTFGPLAGQTMKSDPVTLTGFVSNDNGTIVLSSLPGQPEIRTTEFFTNGVLTSKVQSECHRSRVLTLIGR